LAGYPGSLVAGSLNPSKVSPDQHRIWLSFTQ
jgi:hypothetical protein